MKSLLQAQDPDHTITVINTTGLGSDGTLLSPIPLIVRRWEYGSDSNKDFRVGRDIQRRMAATAILDKLLLHSKITNLLGKLT